MTALAALISGLAHGGFAHLSQAAAGSLVAAVWQGILLAVLVGLGLRLLPKTPAAVRFAIWFGVFLVVTALPVALLLPHTAGATAASGHAPWLVLDEGWMLGIAAVWAVASLVRAGTLVAAAFRVRALWKRARPVSASTAGPSTPRPADAVRFAQDDRSESWIGFAPDDRSGSVRKAQLCVSDEVDRPTVIGFFAPKILIPGWLMEKLTPAELEQVVLHESGHLGRADDWLNLLQKIALVVFPLNPALAWVERRLCLERELAVDERVLDAVAGGAGAAKAYARCLTTLAEYRLERNGLRRGLALVLGALGRESELGRRVGRILEPRGAMRPLHAKLVLGGAALGLLVAATTLERCPQVVGFAAPTAKEQVAANSEQPSWGQAVIAPGGFRAQPVVARMDGPSAQTWKAVGYAGAVSTKSIKKSAFETRIKATRETKDLKTSVPQDAVSGFEAVNVASKAPAPAPAAAQTERLARKAAAARAESCATVTEWTLVVTSWQQDGSRIVMTTEEFSNGAPMASPVSLVAPEQQMQQGVVPYRVVPVRGGWLVFQL